MKITILPDRKPKFETKIKRNDLNPQFNETFRFNVSLFIILLIESKLNKNFNKGYQLLL